MRAVVEAEEMVTSEEMQQRCMLPGPLLVSGHLLTFARSSFPFLRALGSEGVL